jgi:cobalt-zinc-cadmium efflux system membrane fusion protein
MKHHLSFFCSILFTVSTVHAADSKNIILDETGVKNLRIETAIAEESDFAETVFAIGRVEAISGKTGAVSSRISGRITELSVAPGDNVTAGQSVAKVESRQPGDPPPTISLTAPISGLVTEVDSRLGDPVEPDKALLEIINLSEVDAHAHVPEHQAGSLKIGAKANIRVAALPDQSFEGVLLRFGTSAERESGTIDAVFRIPNKDGLIRPEMRAEFSIVISERKNVLSIPRAALQGEASNRFVYVKHFDLPNAFIKTPVQIGEMNDRFVEILTGLFPADEVVTRGAYSLSFAGGGGGVSLKEALDAAHGHEHAEDGGELTPEKRAEMEAKKRAAAGLPPETSGGSSPIWIYVSGGLFLLLLASLFSRFKSTPNPEAN